MDSSSLGDFHKDDHILQKPSLIHHRSKRRKLTLDSDDEVASDNEKDSLAASHALSEEERTSQDEEAEQAKPKSKYKIHIPKNPELPPDAFFTQLPQRSSSPYRIDQFQWKKPTKAILSPQNQSKTHEQQALGCLHPNKSSFSSNHETIKTSSDRFTKTRLQADDEILPDEDYAEILADIPSDAFSSSDGPDPHEFNEPILISSQQPSISQTAQPQRIVAPLVNLRQTTLFGTQASEVISQTQPTRKHNWPLASREEPPTHHKLEREALNTWVYPTNLGTIRDYQFNIVAKGLYHNLLVALPTGLGKTFIAATIMLNWFRWTSEAQIVFVAPTKPLVSQQVKACFEIAGIPRSSTTMLTGGISPGLRAEEWRSKRVFFMTPQTIINDLKTGICDPKKLVLLVVDEAHRATGGYAYVEVVKFLRRFNTNFRVLALTATPGASVESVQEVIDGLGISKIEIRTEESLDIRQYVHARKIETVLFQDSDEMSMVIDLFSRALQPVLDKLSGMNAYWVRDPMMLTPFGCNQARQRWMASDAGRKADFGIKGMVNTIFSLLASLSHGSELLKFHGIGPFYRKILAFRNEIHASGKKGGKYANQINESEPFQTMMSRVQIWINSPDFIGHPKLEYLQNLVMNHFLDASEGRGASDPSGTKVMVFAHYRDSAEEIARVLRRNDPMVRPHVFVGQANSKGSEGMDQKKQLDIIQKFKTGIYNTLVATSIGEEGLDIGEVDLIICYDASASPIRMLQRMGRTGRKRAGNIVVTLMKGKEENNFIKAKDNYEKMQSEIALGTRFIFHDEESRRIVPKNLQPVVDKRVIDIPPENTQEDLPEPVKRGRPPKRPPKKFHMPDGVWTGFVQASKLGKKNQINGERRPCGAKKTYKDKTDYPVLVPSLDEVLLTSAEEKTFERKYLDIQGDSSQVVEIPRNDAFPDLQRVLRPVKYVMHGRATKNIVSMLRTISQKDEGDSNQYGKSLASQDKRAGMAQIEQREVFFKYKSSPVTSDAPRFDSNAAISRHLPSPPEEAYGVNFDLSSETLSLEHPSFNAAPADRSFDDVDDDLGLTRSLFTTCPSTNLAKGCLRFTTRIPEQDGDSEEELPDFSSLVQKVGVTKAVAVAEFSNQSVLTEMGRRRSKRKVVEDDTDDE